MRLVVVNKNRKQRKDCAKSVWFYFLLTFLCLLWVTKNRNQRRDWSNPAWKFWFVCLFFVKKWVPFKVWQSHWHFSTCIKSWHGHIYAFFAGYSRKMSIRSHCSTHVTWKVREAALAFEQVTESPRGHTGTFHMDPVRDSWPGSGSQWGHFGVFGLTVILPCVGLDWTD